jgi:adenylosuccinate synthase
VQEEVFRQANDQKEILGDAMRAFVTVGLGYGDEGKGATTEALVREFGAQLVVRYSGGAQCGHNVVGPSGKKHPFAQWGAGTFAYARTHLMRQVIIDPLSMRKEAEALIADGCKPWALLSVDPRCLVTTPLHACVNRWLEKMRQTSGRDSRHGSCGMGIGETRSYWLWFGEDSIFAEDLRYGSTPRLTEKLDLLRQRLMLRYPECHDLYRFSAPQLAHKLTEPRLRFSDSLPLLEGDSTIVFEGAQGVLLDERWGQAPHYTWSDVTPRNAVDTAMDLGIEDIKVIGVLRTYATRHGAGPLVGNPLPELADDGNPENLYQGGMRFAEHAQPDVGSLLDALAVNCLDQRPMPGWVLEKLALPVMIEGRGPSYADRKFLSIK